jgi:hypothetical protein
MAFLILPKILDNAPGVKKDGNAYVIAEEVDANAFISLGQEVLQLQRLQRVEIGTDTLRLTTHKGEVFFFPPEQLVGFKFGAPEKAARASAGFR